LRMRACLWIYNDYLVWIIAHIQQNIHTQIYTNVRSVFNKYSELQSDMQLIQLTSHYKYTNQHLLNMLQMESKWLTNEVVLMIYNEMLPQ